MGLENVLSICCIGNLILSAGGGRSAAAEGGTSHIRWPLASGRVLDCIAHASTQAPAGYGWFGFCQGRHLEIVGDVRRRIFKLLFDQCAIVDQIWSIRYGRSDMVDLFQALIPFGMRLIRSCSALSAC